MRDRSPSGRTTRAGALRTRETLLTAAAVVFDRQGYSATRLDEVAAAASVTKGALYFHFSTKALLAKAVVDAHEAQCAGLAERTGDWGLNGLDTLERYFAELAHTHRNDPVARAGVRLGTEHRHIEADLPLPFVGCVERVARLLLAAHTDHTVTPSADCVTTSRVLVGSFFGVVEMSGRLTGGKDTIERVYEWWAFLRPGLVARESVG